MGPHENCLTIQLVITVLSVFNFKWWLSTDWAGGDYAVYLDFKGLPSFPAYVNSNVKSIEQDTKPQYQQCLALETTFCTSVEFRFWVSKIIIWQILFYRFRNDELEWTKWTQTRVCFLLQIAWLMFQACLSDNGMFWSHSWIKWLGKLEIKKKCGILWIWNLKEPNVDWSTQYSTTFENKLATQVTINLRDLSWD